MGGSNPRVFIPELIEMYRRGALPMEALVRTYPLAELDAAMKAAADGEVIKPVVMA